MKKCLIVIVVWLIFLSFKIYAGDYRSIKPIEAKWGQKDGEFGLLLEAEGNCPQSLTVDAQGNLAILDPVNKRFQLYSPEGKWIDKFAITCRAFDIQAVGEKFFLLAPYDHLIEKYDCEGRLMERININRQIEFIDGLRISDQKIFVQTMEQVQYRVDIKSSTEQLQSLEQGFSARKSQFKFRTQWASPHQGYLFVDDKQTNKTQTITITTAAELGSLIFLDTDVNGNIFIRKELLSNENKSYFEIDKFDPSGNLLTTIQIQTENIVSPFKPVSIDSKGNIYFLEIKPEGFSVIRWGER